MGTYFVRRILGGLVTLMLALALMQTAVYYMPNGPHDRASEAMREHEEFQRACGGCIIDMALINPEFGWLAAEPWPNGTLRWLFDPRNTAYVDPNNGNALKPIGIDLELGRLRLQGSGALTGDLGPSIYLARSEPALRSLPALRLYGVDYFTLVLCLLVPTLLLMWVACLQRLRRKPVRWMSVERGRALPGIGGWISYI